MANGKAPPAPPTPIPWWEQLGKKVEETFNLPWEQKGLWNIFGPGLQPGPTPGTGWGKVGKTEYGPTKEPTAEETVAEIRAQEEAQAALDKIAKEKEMEENYVVDKYETISEGGWDYLVSYNKKGKEISREMLGRTGDPETTKLAKQAEARARKQQQWEKEWAKEQEAAEQKRWEAQQAVQQAQFEQQMAWQKDQAMMQQAEAERQYRSQLAAQPISWLQYAAYTGEEPVVQPWMQTLMPQEYQTPVGQPIPGFEGGSTGQMYGNVSGMMAGMPELTTPSAQLWSRMGPTAQQQLLGYKQARTGASPEETLWRRSQTTAPGGSFTGLRWNR